jgi:hypothetical protein
MKRPALAPLLLTPIYFLLAPRLISWRQRRAADAEGTVVGTSPTARMRQNSDEGLTWSAAIW